MGFKFRISLKYLVFFIAGVLAATTDAPEKIVSVATTVLPIHSLKDWINATILLSLGYGFKFLGIGYLLETLNPTPKNEYRVKQMKRQIKYGLQSLVVVIVSTTIWLWKGDIQMPYYGYYEDHPYTFAEFLKNLAIYMFVFDSWFYWTHRLMHVPWFWKRIHYLHHQFTEPTAFAQDAVHPIEALIQGPIGHFLPTLFYPMHPVAISVFGFLTSTYALLAHDSRGLDLNDHVKHHHYHKCNFGLYWAVWDYICDTRYSLKKFPVRYIPSWEREAAAAAKNKQS